MILPLSVFSCIHKTHLCLCWSFCCILPSLFFVSLLTIQNRQCSSGTGSSNSTHAPLIHIMVYVYHFIYVQFYSIPISLCCLVAAHTCSCSCSCCASKNLFTINIYASSKINAFDFLFAISLIKLLSRAHSQQRKRGREKGRNQRPEFMQLQFAKMYLAGVLLLDRAVKSKIPLS